MNILLTRIVNPIMKIRFERVGLLINLLRLSLLPTIAMSCPKMAIKTVIGFKLHPKFASDGGIEFNNSFFFPNV